MTRGDNPPPSCLAITTHRADGHQRPWQYGHTFGGAARAEEYVARGLQRDTDSPAASAGPDGPGHPVHQLEASAGCRSTTYFDFRANDLGYRLMADGVELTFFPEDDPRASPRTNRGPMTTIR